MLEIRWYLVTYRSIRIKQLLACDPKIVLKLVVLLQDIHVQWGWVFFQVAFTREFFRDEEISRALINSALVLGFQRAAKLLWKKTFL